MTIQSKLYQWTKPATSMLKHFDIQSFLPTFTPLPTDTSLTTCYQQVVGSLMYTMLGTRPGICFAVNCLSQYGSNPTHNHMIAAQHALKYLATTQHRKLMYGANNSTELIGYSNSDWASNRDDHHSTTWLHLVNSLGCSKTTYHCLIINWSGIHRPHWMFEAHTMDHITTPTASLRSQSSNWHFHQLHRCQIVRYCISYYSKIYMHSIYIFTIDIIYILYILLNEWI